MAILLDPPRWSAHGTLWSHLVSDSTLAELHTFAHAAGIPARGFDGDHYDVPQSRLPDLVARGASPVSGRDLIGRLRASGLRRTPRARSAERRHLQQQWAHLAVAADDDASPSPLDFLLAAWTQRGRLHHGLTHLREVLGAVDVLVAAGGQTEADARVARLGAWFHDAVHAAGLGPGAPHPDPAGSDEAASARLAAELLAGDPQAGHVVDVVLMTATHRPKPGDDAAALLSDADLSVLGATPARYADYAAAIRQEYAAIPEPAFRAGRAEILGRLLEGPIFATRAGAELWEAQARANLAAELARLRA